jgi:hypothetical protein
MVIMTGLGLVRVRRGLAVVALTVAAVGLPACGDDGADGGGEAVECCMLKQLATRCNSPNSTDGLKEAVRQWRQVGESGKADACKALIDSTDNGCNGATLNYDEQDAIVDCT